jgi:hypothetical protein
MNRVKSNSAKRLLPHLDSETRNRLQAIGANQDRALWQQSFRGFRLGASEFYFRKSNTSTRTQFVPAWFKMREITRGRALRYL